VCHKFQFTIRISQQTKTSTMTRTPKMIENKHVMRTRIKQNITQSISRGKDRVSCTGCTLRNGSGCIMDTLHVGMFEHLEGTVCCSKKDKKEMKPCEYRFKAYKYCSTQINGKLGWHNRCPLPICVETYIKSWFAERQYPYNFGGYRELEEENKK
jgi:hypothetical protein